MKIRFTNGALVVGGIMFTLLGFVWDSLIPHILFGWCFGQAILNYSERKVQKPAAWRLAYMFFIVHYNERRLMQF